LTRDLQSTTGTNHKNGAAQPFPPRRRKFALPSTSPPFKPSLASKQDEHGYSLLHAAASYNHVSLLRALVNELNVDVNLKDEDGETCLFVVETVEVAKCLVEELHINVKFRMMKARPAAEKIEQEEDFPEIAAY